MKKLLLFGLVLLLMIVPVSALKAVNDDFFSNPEGGCGYSEYFNSIGNVLSNDQEVTIPVTIEITQYPEYGPAHFDNGELFYSPTDTFFPPRFDYLNYRLFDPNTNTYSNTATVRIEIVHNLFAMSYPQKFFYTPKNTAVLLLEQELSGNLCDADGVGYDIYTSSGPSNGKISLNETLDWGRNLEYTPNAGFTGWDKFSYYCANHGHGCFGIESEAFIYVGNGHPVPEFPTTFLPVTLIIVFLGTVFFIRRTREN
jgi:hypothetical protein